MSRKRNELQDNLLRYYSEQLQRYETLESEVQRLQLSDGDSSEVLGNVRRILREISDCDQQKAGLRDQWKSANESASPELKDTVQRVTQRIEKVIGQVSQTEMHARGAAEQMRPLISDEATRRKVAAAYGAH